METYINELINAFKQAGIDIWNEPLLIVKGLLLLFVIIFVSAVLSGLH